MAFHRDRRIVDLFGIGVPIVQAPMLGISTPAMVVAVAEAGGLGSLSLSTLSPKEARSTFAAVRLRTSKPISANFFCHKSVEMDPVHEAAWMGRLKPYYDEFSLDPTMPRPTTCIPTFSDLHCALVEELRPEVVSFHFGMPSGDLCNRVRKTGAKIVSSATTVEEAVWLEEAGCDAIIAQGLEAGGHRGTFLGGEPIKQIGTIALVPQVVDAVKVPVIAAGGIADPRGVSAAFALGASAVQVGTAFLFCEEANVPPLYRAALRAARADQTVTTNVLTGRPARAVENRIVRELGPVAKDVPAFPFATSALMPLRLASEATGCADFSALWCGQAAQLSRATRAADLVEWLSRGWT